MSGALLGAFRIRPVTYYAVQQCVAVNHDLGEAEWKTHSVERSDVKARLIMDLLAKLYEEEAPNASK